MIELKALGGFELLGRDGQSLHSVLAQPRRQALLAWLALATPRGYHRRDTVLGLLWPELDEARARASLNKAVHQLRTSLGPDVLLSRGQDELGLDWTRIRCDALEFEAAVERGELAEALALYRGDLLPGFFVEDAVEFDQWLERQRQRLRTTAQRAAQNLSEGAEHESDIWAAVRWTQRALQLDPYNEVNVRRLMLLLEQNAGRAEALRTYDDLEKTLEAELGVEPESETRALRDLIHARDPARAVTYPAPAVNAAAPLVPARTAAAAAPPTVMTRALSAAAPDELTRRGRRARAWALLSIIPMAVVAAGLAARSDRDGGSGGAETATVVLPFAVEADSSAADLAERAAALLAERLDRSPEFRIILPKQAFGNGDAADTAYRTAAGTLERAASLGSRFVAAGRIRHHSGATRISITAVLYDTRSGIVPRAHAAVAGPVSDLPRLLDEVAAQLELARPTQTKLHDRGSISRTSPSAASVSATARGQHEYVEGRFAEAVTALRSAVEADSTNAYAYLLMSQAANVSGDWILADWAIERALHFRRRLEPFEHLFARAWDAYLQSRPAEAEELLTTLLAYAPAHPFLWFMMGEVRFHWGPMLGVPLQDAAAAFDRALAANPDFAVPHLHRVRLAAVLHQRPVLDGLLSRRTPPGTSPSDDLELRMHRLLHDGTAGEDPCAELRTLDRARALHLATTLTISHVDDPAIRCAATALEDPQYDSRTNALGYMLRAQSLAAHGRFSDARRILASHPMPLTHALDHDAAFALVPFSGATLVELQRLRAALIEDRDIEPARRHYLIGVTSVQLGDTATAWRHARQLEPDAESNSFSRYYGRLLEAELLRARGQHQQALRVLRPPGVHPDFMLPSPITSGLAHERWLRAELLRELGRDTEALRWYATFPDPAGYDLAWLAPSHLRRAGILARRGDHDTARHHYERVLALWVDADPPLQRYVGTVRARLEASR